MKAKLGLGGLLALGLCGCGTMNNTGAGALGGGALGAGIGALASRHNPLAGAAIGGGVGALAGAAMGNGADRAEQKQTQAQQAAAAQYAATRPTLSLNDVVQMTQRHDGDALIVNQIRTTNSYFSLNASDITYLREQGVSDTVIMEMQNRRGPGAVVVAPRNVVVVEPPPPPPPSFGVGVGVVRRW